VKRKPDVEQMAIVLEHELVDLNDQRRCLLILHKAQFPLAHIALALDKATAFARKIRAKKADQFREKIRHADREP
jgi:hypothetical protein